MEKEGGIMDLSICIPSHRNKLWDKMYETITRSVKKYEWELILVSPSLPLPSLYLKNNVKYLRDFGSPCRCAQIATTLAEGRLLMWGSDDAYFIEDAIDKCVEKFDKELTHKDAICLRYYEGVGHQGKENPDSYWNAWTHADQQLKGVNKMYKLTPVGMYDTQYFRELGGWDCKFEILNVCSHDLAYRLQKNGGKIVLSPTNVMDCDWNPNTVDHYPVHAAHHLNDIPYLNELYENETDRIKIDYFNWMKSPAKWVRRFGL